MSSWKVQAAEEYGSRATEAFKNLNNGSIDSNTSILGVEYRGISKSQFENLIQQAKLRCEKEGWTDDQNNPVTLETLNLYHIYKYIVLPLTAKRKCSYVELVATEIQKPTWFVSHWWGGNPDELMTCLEAHSADHCLDSPDSDSTYYWICLCAINQWSPGPINASLEDTPFYKAIQLTEGTVSILDKNAVAFSRIWCVYELYLSLLSKNSSNRAWCVYTTNLSYGCGLTEGNAPIDDLLDAESPNLRSHKTEREHQFPLNLLKDALVLDIKVAEASVGADKDRILEYIGGDEDNLNKVIRSHFAAAGLNKALRLQASGNTDNQNVSLFWKALEANKSKVLNFDFSFNEAMIDRSKLYELKERIDWSCLEELSLGFNGLKLGNEGVVEIIDRWSFSKIPLVRLCLGKNGIGPEGASTLSEVLQTSKSLKALILRNNSIGCDGAQKIATALKSNETLRILDLDDNAIEDQGAIAIARSLHDNTTLERLLLSDNMLSEKSGQAFIEAFGSNKTLQVLWLRCFGSKDPIREDMKRAWVNSGRELIGIPEDNLETESSSAKKKRMADYYKQQEKDARVALMKLKNKS